MRRLHTALQKGLPMEYRLIASDMDGTLLTDDKRITPAVLNAIRRAVAAGAHFCLASGRPLCGLYRYINELNITSPVITCNGTVISMPDGKVLYRQCLEPETAMRIIKLACRLGVTACVWSDNRLFVNEMNERTVSYHRQSPDAPLILTDDWEKVAAEGIDKILWHSEAECMPEFYRQIEREKIAPVNYFTSNPRYLEFIHHTASKATALRRLAEMYGLGIEQTIAIGDGFNDLDMLETAGLGVAMENADDEIKRRCKFIAPTNNDGGVAAVIDRFIFGK